MNPERSERIEIPVLPLRDVVVYPHMVIPLFVGREKSIRCLEAAMDHDKKIMLVAQKEASTDEPGVNDLFTVGTVASILQMLKLPDGTVKVLVEEACSVRVSPHFLTMANTSLLKRNTSNRRSLMSVSRKYWCAPRLASSKAISS